MHYLLLLANDPDAWDDPDAGADDGVIEDWTAYTEALAAAGVLVSGAALHAPGTATAVRRRDGQALLTDGPWAETKEHLVGFYVIDAPDLDAALSGPTSRVTAPRRGRPAARAATRSRAGGTRVPGASRSS